MPHLYNLTFENVKEESKVNNKANKYYSILGANNALQKRRKTTVYPQFGNFSRHLVAMISPNGYEDDFVSNEKAHTSGDFTS